jgi:hypothetical protein
MRQEHGLACVSIDSTKAIKSPWLERKSSDFCGKKTTKTMIRIRMRLFVF